MGEIIINPRHNVHKKYRQVIYVNPFLITPPVVVPVENTFIGSVAGTLYTPALLAAKLAIDVSRITGFSIVGSDIKCKITGSYGLSGNFSSNTDITYLNDLDGLITTIASNVFLGASNFSSFNLPGLTSITAGRSFENTNLVLLYLPSLTSAAAIAFSDGINIFGKKVRLYIPNCATLGVNVTADESVLKGVSSVSGNIFYLKPSLATINSGGEESDVASARSGGGVIRYVSNFTSPNPVTTLSNGVIYNTAIQLNFTAPTGNTNTIDYYECYANGMLKNIINTSGDYIDGLVASTNYNITIVAVDIFYNKSIISNSINVSTNTASVIPVSNLISYYKLDSNSNDSFGSNNGVSASITYASGKVGSAAGFNGNTSSVIIPYNSNLSFSNGTNDLPFSISFIVKYSANGNVFLIGKSNGTNRIWELIFESNVLIFRLSSNNSSANRLERYLNFTPKTGVYYHVIVTYDGSKSTTGMKLYLDSNEKGSARSFGTTYLGLSTSSDDVIIGKFKTITSYTLNGSMDEISIYNRVLTQAEITNIYNSGQGVTI